MIVVFWTIVSASHRRSVLQYTKCVTTRHATGYGYGLHRSCQHR